VRRKISGKEMLFPKTKKFLAKQVQTLNALDMTESSLWKNVMPTFDEETGYQLPPLHQLYENTVRWLGSAESDRVLGQEKMLVESSIREDTLSTNIAAFTTVALPLVRRIYANSFAREIVSIQNLRGPSGYIFYLNKKYGTQKADESIEVGDRTDQKFPKEYAKSGEASTIRELNLDV